jgi:hypothetical protein
MRGKIIKTEIGKWILQPTGFRAFIPHPFPPKDF